MDTHTFQVGGMNCQNCANHVTEALESVPGVKAVNVTLADNSARVKFDENKTTFAKLAEAVANAGYVLYDGEAKPSEFDSSAYNQHFLVEGMHCGNCAKHVREALEGVTGVERATVVLDENTAYVKSDETVNADSLAEAVAEAGYVLVKG